MILSFAGHFDRRTMNPSPDILRFRRTFMSAEKENGLLKCLARCNFFAGHFAQFPLPGHFVRREFTPSARPADLTYSVSWSVNVL